MSTNKYNEVIVVEGKNDQERIAKIYPNALIITTNGSQISKETLSTIKTLSTTHRIILLLDPDYPGERIRSMIEQQTKNVEHAFIKKSDAISISKKKVGVEHATDEVIINALNNLLTPNNCPNLITNKMLFKLGLIGDDQSKVIRDAISSHLSIGKPNAKTFLKRINMLNITYQELQNIKENLWRKLEQSIKQKKY